MKILLKPSLFVLSLMICGAVNAQYTGISNNYKDETGLPKLNIERSMIYSPGKDWLYNHHAAIIEFKGKLVATWSNGLIDEDSSGQRVVFSVSTDFKHWSAPCVLAGPSKTANGMPDILTAAGLYK
ncbi:MAG: hypothetical protein ABI113_08530, partial [Mucilaginibacter sp.]